MKTLVEIIEMLREEEFCCDFQIKNNILICTDNSETYFPEDVIIEKTERYEGDSNPDDMSVIYAISSNSGVKGILIDAYGTYADPLIAEFIKQVAVVKESENQV